MEHRESFLRSLWEPFLENLGKVLREFLREILREWDRRLCSGKSLALDSDAVGFALGSIPGAPLDARGSQSRLRCRQKAGHEAVSPPPGVRYTGSGRQRPVAPANGTERRSFFLPCH